MSRRLPEWRIRWRGFSIPRLLPLLVFLGATSASTAWPPNSNYDLLAPVGWCLGDSIMRPMSAMLTTLTVDNTSGLSGMASKCLAICDAAATLHSRCMGVQISSSGQCQLLDRDWVFSDTSVAASIGAASLDKGYVRRTYKGIHVVNVETDSVLLSKESQTWACYRRKVTCNAAPNCSALNRYPCYLGKTPNTCDYCLPRYMGPNGTSRAPGNTLCELNTSLPRPTLRIAWPSSTIDMDYHGIYQMYNSILLGLAFVLKWGFLARSPIMPIDTFADFDIEFFGFTENLNLATALDVGGLQTASPASIVTGEMLMAGAGGPLLHDLQIRHTDGLKPHAVLGCNTFWLAFKSEEQLAGAGEQFGVPVVGYDFSNRRTQSIPWYIRSNKVPLDQARAFARVFSALGYTAIFVFTAYNEKGVVANQLRAALPLATVTVQGPPTGSEGPCSGSVAGCIRGSLQAWKRLRERDARIIVHETGGNVLEIIIASHAELLGPKTLYGQIGLDCTSLGIRYAIASAGESTGLTQFYDALSATNNSGPPDQQTSSSYTGERCKSCWNYASESMTEEDKKNLSKVADFLFDPIVGGQYFDSHKAYCPWLPDRATLLSGIGGVDGNTPAWRTAACDAIEITTFESLLNTMCAEADLAADTNVLEEWYRFSDYIGGGEATCYDTAAPGANSSDVLTCESMAKGAPYNSYCGYGDYFDDDDFHPDTECCGCGGGQSDFVGANQVITQKLLDVGFPPSYFQPVQPGGSLYEAGLNSSYARPFLWYDFADVSFTSELLKTSRTNFASGVELQEAILTMIVAYNQFILLGGDSDHDSMMTGPPSNQIEGNPVPEAWRRFLLNVSFQGLKGIVEYVPSTGERNVRYKINQLVQGVRGPVHVILNFSDSGNENKEGEIATYLNQTNALSFQRAAGDWTFLSAYEVTNLTARAIAAPLDNERACDPFPSGFFNGAIAFVRRGTCLFGTKMLRTQEAGALATFIVTYAGQEPSIMTARDNNIKIPGWMLAGSAGPLIDLLQKHVNMTAYVPYSSQAISVTVGPTVGMGYYASTMSYDLKEDKVTLAGVPKAYLKFLIAALNYDSLAADSSLRAAVEESISATLISAVGGGKANVTLTRGSVAVNVKFTVPGSSTPEAVQAIFANANTIVDLTTGISAVSGIGAVSTGAIVISSVSTSLAYDEVDSSNMRYAGDTKPDDTPAPCRGGLQYSLETRSCYACPAGTFPTPGGCIDCPPGSYNNVSGSFGCQMCGKGTYAGGAATNCTPCDSGYVSLGFGQSSCEPCAPGSYWKSELACSICLPGNYSSEPAQTECSMCEPGSVTNAIGATVCTLCSPGYNMSQMGQTVCVRCLVATYAPRVGAVSCDVCPEGQTTDILGATDIEMCKCQQGTFRALGNYSGGLCRPCPLGMFCGVGSDMRNWPDGPLLFPKVLAGRMTLFDDPFQVYNCLPTRNCACGGKEYCGPGQCAQFRDPNTVACGDCVHGAYQSDGDCHMCSDSIETWPLVIAILIAIGFVCGATISVNRNTAMQTNSTLLLLLMCSMMFTGIQALGIFHEMNITWSEPLKSIMSALTLLSFDIKLLKLQCFIGSNPVRAFAFRQAIAPSGIPFILTMLFLKKCRMPKTRVAIEFTNTIGTIMNIFFISVVISAINPFICYDHFGGKSSMRSSSSILCYAGGKHTALIAIGAAAFFLIPFPFLVLTAVFTHIYPRYIMIGDARIASRLQAMRFLFFRYTPERYYHGTVILFRNLVISLIPAVLRDSALQIMCMTALFCTYALIQQQTNPWRVQQANLVEGVITMALVFVLMAGGLATDMKASGGTLAMIGLAAFIAFFSCLVVAMSYGLWKKFKPFPWYRWFICHHKADAGGQSRLIKVLLVGRTGKMVFIDSDDLRELDDLFDTVKTKVEELVVYLTRDTLTRPWCTGEIVTSFRSGTVKVTKVLNASFVVPTEEVLADMSSYLDLTSCSLQVYSINDEDCRIAIRQLCSELTPAILVDYSLRGLNRFDKIACDIIKPNGGTKFENAAKFKPRQNGLLMSTDGGDDEARAATMILYHKIRPEYERASEGGINCLVDYDITRFDVHVAVKLARAIILMLSARTLSTDLQLEVICTGMELCTNGMILVKCPNFDFPSDHYYRDVLPLLRPDNHEECAGMISSLFKKIAANFSIMASDQVLDTQAQEIFDRIPLNSLNRLGSDLHRLGSDHRLQRSITSRQISNVSSPSRSTAASPPKVIEDDGEV